MRGEARGGGEGEDLGVGGGERAHHTCKHTHAYADMALIASKACTPTRPSRLRRSSRHPASRHKLRTHTLALSPLPAPLAPRTSHLDFTLTAHLHPHPNVSHPTFHHTLASSTRCDLAASWSAVPALGLEPTTHACQWACAWACAWA